MQFSTTDTRIGWIGTGVMGQWMCRHLMDHGFQATVTNRTKAKAQPLMDLGAEWKETPEEVAAASDVIFTIVGFPKDVEEVYLGESGILKGARPGAVVVDMTTTSPSLAQTIYKEAASKDVRAVDAPVSGGDVGARNAALSIMVGGDKDTVKALTPLFEIMGKQLVHQGPAGSGQHTKMCNQIVIAGTMIGMCESLLYGEKAGLDLEVMLSSITGGAAACWSLDNLAPRILKGEFDTGFFVEHFVKDMGIALEEARRMNLALPGLALVNQLYQAVMAHGGSRMGTQALMRALKQLNNAI
ncbi:NAD(P)-dependent oxidoreductase [Desulfoluna butyratoxydans]|uniref:6-phosphogluconate dehydrogenase nadp-binding n=1 Tax=Desulfoluna butyratoxydans TaxID=231438 RepID=A0A4U8YKY7_9BACT|nr:NAD(P)-dependent oxidoreductase [Desulfoluna butyratoxydans]VFQ44187.1 6-phosphogluconate dehydrogenase nadp-binding [Desulfoluna butyratoxydans]